ncbi:glycosyltransferase [Marinivivus vitaminiproducens]|uniref:glycosyltransferase n=1 Tax=Marinivivus vitaminiproducens TaxID=3035935 RepID=UPI0027A4AE36|nr:glycosyltransferase [Geminicoccaceae bacterium SCSIO 64248]
MPRSPGRRDDGAAPLHCGIGAAPPRRIAFFTPDLRSGGVQGTIVSLAKAMRGFGFAVDVVVSRFPDGAMRTQIPADIRVVPLERSTPIVARLAAAWAQPRGLAALGPSLIFTKKVSNHLPSLPALARYLKTTRPDVLYAAMAHPNIQAILARSLAGVPTRVVVSDHSSEARRNSTFWRKRDLASAMRHTYAQADVIVAVSQGVADDLATTVGLPRERITTLYNPVIGPDLPAKAAAPVDHPWFATNDVPVILTVGRLEREKGHDVLLEAFAKLQATRRSRLVIIGSTTHKPWEEKLVALAADLGMSDRVDFLGYEPNPVRFMARADLFVLSSVYEGFGNVLVEALACGCPVVSTDCPSGPREILDGGRYGRLTPVGDVDALALAMAATLESPPAKADLQARAGHFDYDAAITRYRDVLLGTPPPVSRDEPRI